MSLVPGGYEQQMSSPIPYLRRDQSDLASEIAQLEEMLGGMNGTVLSGAAQFGKTLILRSLFGWVWNFCSSQELDMPAFDTVLKGLPPNPAA